MEFKVGEGATIVLPPLPITIYLVICLFFLIKWSKQLETRRFSLYFYFLISAYTTPVYSSYTEAGVFRLYIPLGFIFIICYLFSSKKKHPAKMKASILGFCLALYQLYFQYFG
ncbi:hypothetical protein [Bacillus sp. 1P06AnD]|uniref:hypothetical protein n=1 Tax=Bacillus sp. 1P06AnD TaxID=3132208 RepID=UPI0039A273F4